MTSSSPNLGRQGGRGALAGMGARFIRLGMSLGSLTILARLLTPEDYGQYAMVMVVAGFASLIGDMGLTTAAIRAESLDEHERSNLWWINTGLGAAFMILMLVGAPALGRIYQEPAIVPIALAVAVIFLIQGMSAQYRADLIRRMRFGQEAVLDISMNGVSILLSIALAAMGFGAWALVIPLILTGLLTMAALMTLGRWVPKRYRRDVSVRPLVAFGLPMMGTSLLSYASGNVDGAIIGRVHGDSGLGLYSRGLQVVRMPMNVLRAPLTNVALSTLAKVRSDAGTYARYVATAQLAVIYPIAAMTTWLAATAEPLIPLLLGPGWDGAALLVTLFALGDGIATLASAGGWLYAAEGKSAALLRYTMISATVRIIFFAVAAPFGLVAMAAVYGIASLILWPLSLWMCGRATGYDTRPLFVASLRVLVVFGVVFGAGRFVVAALETAPVLEIAAVTAAQAATLFLLQGVPAIRRDLHRLAEVFRNLLRRPAS